MLRCKTIYRTRPHRIYTMICLVNKMSTPRIDETISKQEDDSWAVWFTSLIAVLKEQYNYTKLPIPKQKEFDQLLINLPLNISETKNKILQLEPQLAKDILEKT